MNRTAFLQSLSPFGKLLFFTALVLIFSIAVSLLGIIVGMIFYDVGLTDMALLMTTTENNKYTGFLKFYQTLSQIGGFVVPSLLFAYLVSNSTSKYLLLNRKPKIISVLIIILIVFTILPFNSYLDEINQRMTFPASLSGMENWMKEKEDLAFKLMGLFLMGDTIWELLVNIIVVAFIPAIAEEFLFRGVLLKLLNQWFKNIHIAIIISAIVFSAFHLQFYGFLPRLMMGIILGYVFVITANLWIPIILHFINNSASVIIYFLHENNYINISADEFGHTPNIVYIIGSLLISIWLMIMIYQKERSEMILPE